MPKKLHIGIATVTGITLGTFLWFKTRKSSENSLVEPFSAEEENSYISHQWSAEEKKTDRYKKLLARWGTKEGLMELSDASVLSKKATKKQKRKRFNTIEKVGVALAQKHKIKHSKKSTTHLKAHQKLLTDNNEVTQITVSNNSSVPQKANLWGGNTVSQTNLAEDLIEIEEFQANAEIHPQNAIFNPRNGYFYIVNQLSDSVSVLRADGTLVSKILLKPIGGLAGSISPVDLTVNTSIGSTTYGFVYVIGSVSNSVYEIDTNLDVKEELLVGVRPIAIAYNSNNSAIYVANLISNSLTQIDVETKNTTEIPGFNSPKAIGIDSVKGNVYVFNSSIGTIDVLAPNNNLLKQGVPVFTGTGKFTFNRSNNSIYFSVTELNEIVKFNSETLEISETIAVGLQPLPIAYNSVNKLLYVGNKGDQNFTRISSDDTILDTITLGAFDNGLAINNTEDIVLTTSILNSLVQFRKEIRTPVVSFSEDYEEYREDFQHNPAQLQHLRVIGSGEERLNALQFVKKSVSGKEICTTHSLRNYDSPQNFGNISELFDVKGSIIDGRNSWCFTLPPNQKFTFLMYHKQFETYDLLPETSRKSTGVQMSKGIPKHWI